MSDTNLMQDPERSEEEEDELTRRERVIRANEELIREYGGERRRVRRHTGPIIRRTIRERGERVRRLDLRRERARNELRRIFREGLRIASQPIYVLESPPKNKPKTKYKPNTKVKPASEKESNFENMTEEEAVNKIVNRAFVPIATKKKRTPIQIDDDEEEKKESVPQDKGRVIHEPVTELFSLGRDTLPGEQLRTSDDVINEAIERAKQILRSSTSLRVNMEFLGGRDVIFDTGAGLRPFFNINVIYDEGKYLFTFPRQQQSTRYELSYGNLLLLFTRLYSEKTNREESYDFFNIRDVRINYFDIDEIQAFGKKKIKTFGIHRTKKGIGFTHTYHKDIPCLFTAFFSLKKRGRESIHKLLSISDPILVKICKEGNLSEFLDYVADTEKIRIPTYLKKYNSWISGDNNFDKVLVVDNRHCGLVSKDKVSKYTEKINVLTPENYKMEPFKNFTRNIIGEKKKSAKDTVNEYFFDIESVSDNGLQIPWLIIVYEASQNRFIEFWGKECPQNFGTYLREKTLDKETHVFWGFNSGKYDLVLLLRELTFEKCIIRGTLTTIKQLECGDIFFNDILCLLPLGSLKKQCEIWEVETPKMDFDIADKDADFFESNKTEIIKYCITDVKASEQVLKKFRKTVLTEYSVLNLDPRYICTIASLTTKIFRLYLPEVLEGTTGEIYENERSSYYGGICYHTMEEVEDAFYYDINSSYPFAMTKAMPYKYLSTKQYSNESLSETNLYYCTFSYKDDSICTMTPLRTKDGLQYAKDIDWSWRWGCELIFLTRNQKLKMLEIKEYQEYESAKIFSPYIYDIYEKKKNAENVQKRTLYKLLMNSLYGKFGQRNMGGTWLMTGEEVGLMIGGDDFNTFRIERIRLVDKEKDLYEFGLSPDSENYNWIGSLVRLAAYISAQAKCTLFDAVYSVGEENVAYMDTDSIISKVDLPEHLQDELELGKWKLEQKCEKVYLWGPKLYCIDGKVKMKGVSNTKINVDEMIEKREVETRNIVFRRFFGGVVVEEMLKKIKVMDSRRDWVGGVSRPR